MALVLKSNATLPPQHLLPLGPPPGGFSPDSLNNMDHGALISSSPPFLGFYETSAQKVIKIIWEDGSYHVYDQPQFHP